MTITANELQTNLLKYLELAETEEIFISRGGRKAIKLSNPDVDDSIEERVKLARSLAGIIPADITLEEAREERLSKL